MREISYIVRSALRCKAASPHSSTSPDCFTKRERTISMRKWGMSPNTRLPDAPKRSCPMSTDRVLGFGEPSSHQAEDIRSPTHDVPHIRMDRRRSYAHEDFVIADHRLVDFSELQIIRRSVPLLDDRLHRRIKSLGMPARVRRGLGRHAQATWELSNEAVERRGSPAAATVTRRLSLASRGRRRAQPMLDSAFLLSCNSIQPMSSARRSVTNMQPGL
jgi:hypothetical protein